MRASDTRAFVCPACEEQMNVSPAAEKAVLQNGCPFCTDAVGKSAFVS